MSATQPICARSSICVALGLAVACLPITVQADPIASWDFEGGTIGEPITRGEDGNGRGNDLVAWDGDLGGDPVYVSGLNGSGTAARFDGTSGLIVPNSEKIFDFRSSYTIAMWVQVDPGQGGTLVQKSTRPRFYDPELGIDPRATLKRIGIASGGTLEFTDGTLDGGGASFAAARVLSEPVPINDGMPHHIAITQETGVSVPVLRRQDCNGDGFINSDDDVNQDGVNDCRANVEEIQGHLRFYIDGVELGDPTAFDPSRCHQNTVGSTPVVQVLGHRNLAAGDLALGYSAPGVEVEQDLNFDGITPDRDCNGDNWIDTRDLDEAGSSLCPENPPATRIVRGPGEIIGFVGTIDEVEIYEGALTAAEISELIQGRGPCTGKGNATVEGIEILSSPLPQALDGADDGIEDGESGPFVLRAVNAADPEGSPILYKWTAVRTGGGGVTADALTRDVRNTILSEGPTVGLSEVTLHLPAGRYEEIRLEVFDSLLCPDVVGDANTARFGPFTLLPIAGFPEARFGTKDGGVQIYLNYTQPFKQDPPGRFWEVETGSQAAFGGDYMTRNPGGGGRLDFLFDISEAGGLAGTWYVAFRLVNQWGQSDFGIVDGDLDDILVLNYRVETHPVTGENVHIGRGSLNSQGENGLSMFDDTIMFGIAAGPSYTWSTNAFRWMDTFCNAWLAPPIEFFSSFAGPAGERKELRDGLNRWVILNRKGGHGQMIDLAVWYNDPSFKPTDQDVKEAVDASLVDVVLFNRGDANGDGRIHIADPTFVANYLFGIEPALPPPCEDAADANGDGSLNIADPSFIANFVFGILPARWPPLPGPGRSANCGAIGTRSLVLGCTTPPASCNDL